MINADKALNIILSECKTLFAEKVKLRNACGRTLAEDIVAKENIPPFDNSSMDGFAIRSVDLRKASTKNPVVLTIVGEASAGNLYRANLNAGETIRIMTGAKVPAGADSIVPIELATIVDDRHVSFAGPAKPEAYIRRTGEDIGNGEIALKKGELISPAHTGILASLGQTKVKVVRKPCVNILATGTELVDIDEELPEGCIRNSSSYTLQAFVRQTGGDAALLGIVNDKKKHLRKAISNALDCDVLLLTGGVSVGKYDLVKEILEHLKVEIKFWRVNIKPGKPLLFGTFKKTLVFGLPGNPASTGVTFLQFVLPTIKKMLGQTGGTTLHLSAILDELINKSDGKRHFVRGIVSSIGGTLHVRTTGTQSSGVMSSLAKANCLIILPEKSLSVPKGSRVTIQML